MGAGVSALLALADRVEGATGADRELDGSIGWAIGRFDHFRHGFDTTVSFYRIDDYSRAEIHVVGPKGGRVIYTDSDLPAYSASLDAAMGLVPEGDSFTVGQNVHHKHWVASVNYLGEDGAPHSRSNSYSSASPALALTAAALRARAAMLGETKL